MRLDKYIAHATGLPRKDVKRLLRADRVCVNGAATRDGSAKLKNTDRVTLDEESLTLPGHRYYMLHKPEGFVCTHDPGAHPTVFDLLPDGQDLQAVGRLDLDTTGLVLLTDDGQWNHRATSPNRGKVKRYRVWTRDPIEPEQVDAFAAGILLHGESKHCRPAQLEPEAERCALLDIGEGKYHQVKRMFAAVGNRVEQLHRVSVGDIVLDEGLKPGRFRPLTDAEIASV